MVVNRLKSREINSDKSFSFVKKMFLFRAKIQLILLLVETLCGFQAYQLVACMTGGETAAVYIMASVSSFPDRMSALQCDKQGHFKSYDTIICR